MEKNLNAGKPGIFDLIAEVKASAKWSVVAIDLIDPRQEHQFRYSMDDFNDRAMSRYLEEMKEQGQIIYVNRSRLIWAPEPLYGPPMVVDVQDSNDEYDFQALTQKEVLNAYRIGGFRYVCVNIVSGDEDSLFLAAVYDNTENGHRYRYHEITSLIQDLTDRFPHINDWEIARLTGAEPALIRHVEVLDRIARWKESSTTTE